MLKKILEKKRGRAGFTLMELLVTVVIIGIISITTFAIVISSMNTFNKEHEVMQAVDVKEMVCLTLKEHLRKRAKIGLLSENLAEPYDVSIAPPLFGDAYKDDFGYYVVDNRLKEYHMLYSEDGRIYTITSNIDGKYYIDENDASALPPGTLKAMPISTVGLSDGKPTPTTLNGEYGRVEFLPEKQYGEFFVDVKFKPIFTNTQGRYRDLQVIVTVYNDENMSEEDQVAKGTETFHMLNIENRKTAINFQNDKAVMNANPTMKTPQEDNYDFCYFV